MDGVSAALYIDFDNVFSGLVDLDLNAALRFAEQPGAWLEKLATAHTLEGPRRWAVLRCYLNSAGSTRHPRPEHPRISLAPFRQAFVRAGFEVVDCPALTPQMKNAADIKMAIDVVESLQGPARYDEYVIASADSDFTPLLSRLRAALRRTTLVCTFGPVDALTAVADRYVSPAEVLGLLGVEGPRNGSWTSPASSGDARATFASLVQAECDAASEPLELAVLEAGVRAVLGPVVDETRWFGYTEFRRAVQGLTSSDVRVSSLHAWDAVRHVKPQPAKKAAAKKAAPVKAAPVKAVAKKATPAKKGPTRKATG